MNALLASIFSPLKEPDRTANRPPLQGASRLQDHHGSPGVRKRHHGGVAKRRPAKRKAVAFDMTPKKDVMHTPPKQKLPVAPLPRQRPEDDAEDGEQEHHSGGHVASAAPEDGATTAHEGGDEQEHEGDRGRDQNEGEFTFKRLAGHRWDDDALQIQVEWDSGETTWEPEARLHEDAPDALLAYWDSIDGRPENPGRPGYYEIHAVRKHTRDRKRLFVEWVGYGAKDGTWEPRRVVEDAAPGKASEYWDSLPRPRRRRRPRLP